MLSRCASFAALTLRPEGFRLPRESNRARELLPGICRPVEPIWSAAAGNEKHLVATDHLESEQLRSLSVADLFDIVARHGLHFHHARETGIVFHMISCPTERGRVGLTAVGNTRAEPEALCERAQRILLEEARVALIEEPLRR